MNSKITHHLNPNVLSKTMTLKKSEKITKLETPASQTKESWRCNQVR